MEKLIFLAIVFIITALHSWWKKRHGEPDDEETPWPGQPPRPRPPPPRGLPGSPPGSAPPPATSGKTNWEEELRRLLQGETAPRPQPLPTRPPPSPPSPPSPPVIAARAPRAVPPPLVPPTPAPARRPAVALPVLARSQIPVPEEGREEEVGLPVKMPTLEQSAKAYLSARTLDARVAARLKQVDRDVITHQKTPIFTVVSPAIGQGLALLRDRQSQRAAILVSVILGPPKALEQ